MSTFEEELVDDRLVEELLQASDDEIEQVMAGLPDSVVSSLLALMNARYSGTSTVRLPASPLEQALELDEGYRVRPHLELLSERIAAAVQTVEAGGNARLIVEMPPRSGKTTLATIYTGTYVMRHHPDWPIALTSHDGRLATSWGRQVRRYIEQNPYDLEIARDAGAASEWETTAGGRMLSVSVRESFTGRGAKVLVIDDPHKDFTEAHSSKRRDEIWSWWQSVAQLRLEPSNNALVIVIMTRWHEDDLVGRLLSADYDGDPDEWEVIRLPALADEPADPIGRSIGEPLLSPLMEETAEQATARWEGVRRNVGPYVFNALMQQSPSPAQGSIFNIDWWRFWTTDPEKVSYGLDGKPDGRVVLFDPSKARGRWIDSWDAAFKKGAETDYVVGQRWVGVGSKRYLIHQFRGRISFTETLTEMRLWNTPATPYHSKVSERVIEDKANGSAILDTLKEEISNLVPGNPGNAGKEERARAESPQVWRGDVYLPHPDDPGNDWVRVLLAELREFPTGANDDQVDALTQALKRLRGTGEARISVPGGRTPGASLQGRSIAKAARTTNRRISGPGRR